jgi:hypothetical protein
MPVQTHPSAEEVGRKGQAINERKILNGHRMRVAPTDVLTHDDLQEIGRQAEAIYENELRDIVETDENIGKFLTLDINSGDYEIGADDIEISDRLRARRPNAYECVFRIGYETADAHGARLKRRSPRTTQ